MDTKKQETISNAIDEYIMASITVDILEEHQNRVRDIAFFIAESNHDTQKTKNILSSNMPEDYLERHFGELEARDNVLELLKDNVPEETAQALLKELRMTILDFSFGGTTENAKELERARYDTIQRLMR